MPDFKSITLSDKGWMDELFTQSDFRSEEYNFTFCFIWRDVFRYGAARLGDRLLLKSNSRRPSYLFPPGGGDAAPAIEALLRDAEDSGHGFVFHTVLPEQVKLLEVLYPRRFVFSPLEDYYDYIYDAQSLITLKGKKLHAKRNHINRFKEMNPDWSYEPITDANLPEVAMMSAEWCRINECRKKRTMSDEACAVDQAIRHFMDLGMDGGLIRAGGRVVAFSMGERLNSDTYLVHIEKAFSEVQGAYAVINQQFAFHNCGDFLYINREDDSGQEGLRKAKHSYYPVMMAEKYRALLVEK